MSHSLYVAFYTRSPCSFRSSEHCVPPQFEIRWPFGLLAARCLLRLTAIRPDPQPPDLLVLTVKPAMTLGVQEARVGSTASARDSFGRAMRSEAGGRHGLQALRMM